MKKLFSVLKCIAAAASLFTVFALFAGTGYVHAEGELGYIVEFEDNPDIYPMQTDNLKRISKDEPIYSAPDMESILATGRKIKSIEPEHEYFFHTNVNWHHEKILSAGAINKCCFGNDVTVAVIDSGLAPDAYIEHSVLPGYNATDGSSDTTDLIGHGTFTTSLICANDNPNYAFGISPRVHIVPIRCADDSGTVKTSYLFEAINKAVELNCDVINMSLGGTTYDAACEHAIKEALSQNILLCASVGNNAQKGNPIMYPASYDGVIGVGAVDKNNTVAYFSEHNKTVDVVAPGVEIYGKAIPGFSFPNSGTSFACPMVTAAAAIAKGIDKSITADEFYNILMNTSTDLGKQGYDEYYGWGLMNIQKITDTMLSRYYIYQTPVSIMNGKALYSVTNNSSVDFNMKSIFASYENNRFIGSEIFNIVIPSGKTTVCTPLAKGTQKHILLYNDNLNLVQNIKK